MEYEVVTCKYCGADTPKAGVFCMVCGERLARRKREKGREIRVPKPHKLASGEWVAQLMVDGSRETVRGETEAEYYDKARAIKAGVLENKKALPRFTLEQAEERYIEKRKGVLSPSTVNGYESIKDTRFSAYKSKSIDGIDWQKMVNDEAALDVSARTVKNAWGFVKSVLKDAGRQAPEITLPQVVNRDLAWLDYEQIKLFLDAVQGRPCELAALLALHSLRRSELLELTPGKVDLEKLVLHIEGSRVRGSDGMVSKDTNKNATSRRDVPIMIPRLKTLLEAKQAGPVDQRLITTNPNSMHGQINAICEKAGLPLVGVHGLRRSFASLAYHLRWSELQTMRVGGWSDPTVVRRVYTKLAQSDVDAGVESMRNYYGFTTTEPGNAEESTGIAD